MAMAWCGYSRKGRQSRASSGGGAAGWSVSTSIPYIPWRRRSNKALKPFSGGVSGWVFCAKNWQLKREWRVRLAVRLGIHTGVVVVGEMGGGGRQEQLALGETPNVAARIQSLATPDTVVISESTHRLIQGFFTCHVLGPRRLRGVTQAVRLYRALDVSDGQSRLDVTPPKGLTPLVGRDTEVALL